MECTRRFEFDSAHRIIGHNSKCRFLHGHRYALELTVVSQRLDNLGMVADFGELKSIVLPWLEENLDHNIILWSEDKELGEMIEKQLQQKIYYLPFNPTVENIALHLKQDIFPRLFKGKNFQVSKIRLFETVNCFVDA